MVYNYFYLTTKENKVESQVVTLTEYSSNTEMRVKSLESNIYYGRIKWLQLKKQKYYYDRITLGFTRTNKYLIRKA